MNVFFKPKKLEKEISPVNNYLKLNIKEKVNLFIPKKKFQNNTFSENIELIKKDDNIVLYSKIRESIDKMLVNHYKKNRNFNEIPTWVFYYYPYNNANASIASSIFFNNSALGSAKLS